MVEILKCNHKDAGSILKWGIGKRWGYIQMRYVLNTEYTGEILSTWKNARWMVKEQCGQILTNANDKSQMFQKTNLGLCQARILQKPFSY